MANYVTTSYLKSFNPYRTYNTTSKPTLAQVTSYIPSICAEMDCRMAGVGITIPIVTSPVTSISKYLKYIAALGCAGMAENSAFMGGHKNDSEHSSDLMSMYETKLKAIEKNPALILGSTNSASFDSYEYSNPDENRDDPAVIRDEDNW